MVAVMNSATTTIDSERTMAMAPRSTATVMNGGMTTIDSEHTMAMAPCSTVAVMNGATPHMTTIDSKHTMAMAPCLTAAVMNGATTKIDTMVMAPCFSAMNSMVMNNATPQQMDSDQEKTPCSLAAAPWQMHSEWATTKVMNCLSFKRWVNLKNGQEFVYDSRRYLKPRDEGPLLKRIALKKRKNEKMKSGGG